MKIPATIEEAEKFVNHVNSLPPDEAVKIMDEWKESAKHLPPLEGLESSRLVTKVLNKKEDIRHSDDAIGIFALSLLVTNVQLRMIQAGFMDLDDENVVKISAALATGDREGLETMAIKIAKSLMELADAQAKTEKETETTQEPQEEASSS